MSKVLQVVDELRAAMGHPAAHDDSQTKELATAADPHAILTAIKEAEEEKSDGNLKTD